MLVIGHRGAAGLARENSLEALRAGLEANADMLEFDVRLTKDKIPVLVHDFHTVRTHRSTAIISRLKLADLQETLKDSGQPLVLLEKVLDEFFGVIVLNIELKGRGTGKAVGQMVKNKYIKKDSHWDNILFSSFHAKELWAVRRVSELANLSLLHFQNPFMFIAFQRGLRLTAVGFHRLYLNRFAIEIAKRADLFIYAYTVNRPHTALLLAQQGIDGIVTDHPNNILKEIAKHPVND